MRGSLDGGHAHGLLAEGIAHVHVAVDAREIAAGDVQADAMPRRKTMPVTPILMECS
jgi:hypothetical protein